MASAVDDSADFQPIAATDNQIAGQAMAILVLTVTSAIHIGISTQQCRLQNLVTVAEGSSPTFVGVFSTSWAATDH